MTSSKEYNMLFKLKAQIGNDFGITFSAAKKALNDTQKEIQALNKQQSDISSYQKQQQAVDATARKLEDLKKEHDNIQREIQETEGYSSALENKLVEKEAAIDKTSASLALQTEKLDRMGESLRDAGVDTSNLGKESEKLKSKIGELANEQERLAEEVEKAGEKGKSALSMVGDALIAAGIAQGLKEIYEGYKECISIAADFEETMSTVEALSGASAQEMQELSSYAKQLGATTKFTAKESAEAMTYMGMAGWDATQMMEGMSGVLNLAAASGENLAATSDIVTDNLTAFGLKASDTAHFSDVLAAAATNSNTSVAIMGETFKNSAALAGALGYSVEDVAVAIGLMANAGIKGSNAGTALKNVFNGLLSGVTLTSEAFGEVEYSAIKADGTMKPFGETLQELRGYFEQMTGAEKMQNAETLAGQRAMSGFVSIMNSTDADFNSLTASINDCSGAAQKMADIKMDNLNGQITLLNSAADGLKTTVGEAYNTELRALAKIGTDILTDVNDFLQKNPVLLKSIIAITAELGVFLALYKGVPVVIGAYNTVKTISNSLKAKSAALTAADAAASGADAAAKTGQAAATTAATAAQTGLNTAMMANPVGLVIAAVAALTVGVIALVEAEKKAGTAQEDLTAKSREQYEQLQKLNEEYETACQVYGETSEEARALHGELILLEEDYSSSKKTMAEFNSEVEEDISNYREFIEEHRKSISEINTEEDVILALVSRLETLAQQTNKTQQEKAQMIALVDQLNEKLPSLGMSYDAVSDSLNTTAEAIRKVVEAEIARKKYEQNYKDYTAAVEKELELEKDLATAKENTAAAQKEYDELLASDTYKQMQIDVQYVGDEVSGRQFASKYQSFNAQLSKARAEVDRLTKSQNKLQKEYDESVATEKDLLDAMGIYSETIQQTNEETKESVDNSEEYAKALEAVRNGYLDVETAAKYFGVSAEILQSGIDEVESYKSRLESAMDAVSKGYYTSAEAAEIYGVTSEAIEVASGIQSTIDKIEELGQAYRDVKDAAEKSIQGQYELWDTAAVVIPADIGAINTSLETQLSYWSDYNTDLANLLGRTGDVEGLSEVIASFADGSAESVNAIAGMAAASDEDLRKMVKTWQDVKQEQEEASEAIAEIATGFGEQIEGMRDDLEDAIEGLNLDDESEEAAKATITAYVAAIEDGTSDAVSAAERLSKLVANALNASAVISVVVSQQPNAGGGKWTSFEDAAAFGYSNVRTRNEFYRSSDKEQYGSYEDYLSAMQQKYSSGKSLPAYASGTESAVPGLALVGEEGPELVTFRGGEHVYTANQTKTLLSEYKTIVKSLPAQPIATDKNASVLQTLYQYISNEKNNSTVFPTEYLQQPIVAGGIWTSYEDAASAGYPDIRTQSEFNHKETDKQKYGTYDAYLASMQKKYTGYAAGTDNALPGLALVGENGPELVLFDGGERVYTTEQTKALLADYREGTNALHAYASGTGEDVQIIMLIPLVENLIEILRGYDVEKPQAALQRDGVQNVYITVSPSFTVESGNDELEERLRSFSDIVTDNVMNALDEAGIDAKRGAYV